MINEKIKINVDKLVEDFKEYSIKRDVIEEKYR
jgi:hypothetical protein